MKGLFIPEITAEMFRNGCLESIQALMAEGEIYDIDYQQPCEDCISRESIKQKLQEQHDFFVNAYGGYSNLPQSDKSRVDEISNCIAMVVNEPPVTPKQKTGHWLMPQQDDGMSDPIYYQVRCSECGFDLDPQTWHMELHQYGADKYCPNCGARMTESEDEE